MGTKGPLRVETKDTWLPFVLGGNMDLEQPQPWFKHPEFPLEINIILDICHMLQLVRNAWEF
jgi:hypothetical protein